MMATTLLLDKNVSSFQNMLRMMFPNSRAKKTASTILYHTSRRMAKMQKRLGDRGTYCTMLMCNTMTKVQKCIWPLFSQVRVVNGDGHQQKYSNISKEIIHFKEFIDVRICDLISVDDQLNC